MLSYADKELSGSDDGISSLLLTLEKKIQNLLNKDIDSLKFPAVIKKSLKTSKALLNLFTTVKINTETTSELKNQDNNKDEN